jgi:hypothetical protein
MDVLPATNPFTFTINSLLVTGGATVTLQRTQAGGGIRIFQLASTNSITQGLKIDAGCTLTIDAIAASGSLSYELALTGGAGVMGEILGNLYFKGTGAIGSCMAELDLQDDATHYADLKVKNGGMIKYFDNTGTTSPSTGSYLTMESGSTYLLEKNAGSFPPGNWDLNSLARTYNVLGTSGPSFLGNAYGNLEWDCQNQNVATTLNKDISFNNVNFITTNGAAFRVRNSSAGNSTMTINGNLNIGNGAFIDIVGSTAPAGSLGKITLKGNLNIDVGGFLTTNGAPGAFNQFELNGSSNQNITVNGSFSSIKFQFIMNGVSATLLTPLTILGNTLAASGPNLQLISGKIITTTTNFLKMVRNSSVSGGSTTSFVQGPMKKVGDNATFTFPLGIGSIYTPVTFTSTGMGISDEITAEYHRTNPQGAFGNTYNPAGNPEIINHISFVEYWSIEKTIGVSTTVSITLPVTQYSFCKVFATTFVARFDIPNARWTNCGTASKIAGPSFGPYQTGTITTPVLPTQSFGVFTLGTNDTYGVNPLPINFIAFEAIKLNTSKSSVAWELSACCSDNAKFEIQRAGSDRNFSTIGTARGSTINTSYIYTDNGLKVGINYYRLKMIDDAGTITYSRIAVIVNGADGLLLTSLMPSTVINTTILAVASSKEQKINLVITDMMGRVVQRQDVVVIVGNSNLAIRADGLAAGAYQLCALVNGQRTNTLRFVKQ